MTRPVINVTPLIDVLLVLLIIFMVLAPLKPNVFKTRIPAEPKNVHSGENDPQTLVASIRADGNLRLNSEVGLGTVDDPSKFVQRLRSVFEERIAANDISDSIAADADRPFNDRIERSVFIKAPTGLSYGQVARLIDAVKSAGAFPIALQIDGLEN